MPTRNFRLAIAAALLIGLSACESLGPMSSPKVAERDPDNPQTASANISSLSDVIERRPNDPIAFNQRGIAYARNGDYQEAIADFSSAVKLNGKFAEAYTNRALAYRQIEKDDQALADFNAAIVANPNYAPAFLGRGNLLRTHAHYDDAMADLNAAIRLKPEDAQAYHARGLIYQRQGDCVRAITDFNNAIDRDPFVEAPYEARGHSTIERRFVMNRNVSQSRDVQITVSLAKLIPSKRNPRRVKPQREAHRQMVASIRAHGLLAPLVVRADENGEGNFKVIAGNRRLAALREVYKDAAKPPKIPCVLRSVDDDTADALALAENFIREPMHPMDEAASFAHLAQDEGKGAEAIAAQFGVKVGYIRQRIKLATLAEPIQAVYRQGGIDTATAEAFASVPPDRQLEVWQEVGGNPQDAYHVRNVIAHAWIDAESATFDVSKLPDGALSKDLFAERVLVERKAFMEAQAEALLAQRQMLTEEGWADVVIGPQGDVQDRLYAMADAPQEYDEATTAKLKKLADKRGKLEAKFADLDEDNDPDDAKAEALSAKVEALDEEERALTKEAEVHYAEATKAVGTAFLLLDPDGRVRREYRIPRQRHSATGNGVNGNGQGGGGAIDPPKPPTSDDLKEPQLAATFTHQALAVRETLLGDPARRKRVLALILHDRVRSEALAIRHDANGTTLHADHAEGFTSSALVKLREKRSELDPLADQHYVEDVAAYEAVKGLSERKLDALIDLLTVECVTAHLQRKTALVWRLAEELGVEVRRYWRPDEKWLASYQKIQLAHLIGELRGPVYARAAENKKKSELVSELAKLFADAATGSMEDAKVAAKLNEWLPANLREEAQTEDVQQASAA